jgi:membrane protein YqaA with SNARE-associated domain
MDLFSLGYFGLFGGAFLSATIIPFPSEGLLIGFFELNYEIWISVTVATVGNTLGGAANYYLGRFGNSKKMLKRFKLDKWSKRSMKDGHWLGLLAWLPILGDPMLVALGFLKSRFWPLLLTVFIGKLGRYLILVWIYFSFSS